MISERLGGLVRERMLVIGTALANVGLTANMMTAIGFVLNCVVAIVIAAGYTTIGGVLVLFSSGFDVLDGAVARASGKTSPFGGFFDATVDRYSEIVVYVGLLYYLLDTDDFRAGAMLTLLAAAGALMVSYARARAESNGFEARVGILARPERVVILSIGLITGYPVWALAILAIGTNLTAIVRMAHVYRQSQQMDAVDPVSTANSLDLPKT